MQTLVIPAVPFFRGEFGAQVAAAVISAYTEVGALVPGESGFTVAFALAAGAAGLALVPAAGLGRRGRGLRVARPALSPA